MSSTHGGYYVPQPSHWPIVGSIGLFLTTGGFAMALPSKAGDPMGSLAIMYAGFGDIGCHVIWLVWHGYQGKPEWSL